MSGSRPSRSRAVIEGQMRQALICARRGAGRVHPNPSVGAVVFRGERLLGRGRTQPPGGPHAEIVALGDAVRRHGARAVKGASLAVTLEPCCFQGRTGPCTEAIDAAGIGRVFVGCRDPHPEVDGRGMRWLRRRGVEVLEGILEEACREHHRGFFRVHELGRPFVSLKLASSLDARIATRRGESRWITGPEARAMVHRLRARTDAVMVGSETALADDPLLSARRGDRIVHRPVRIVVDSRLRLNPGARLLDPASGGPAWLLTAPGARGRAAIVAAGARLIDVPRRGGHLDLRAGLQRLAEAGLTEILVEGGGGLAAALLRSNLVDEIHWVLAPRLIGQEGRPALGELGIDALSEARELEDWTVRRLGRDLHVRARVRAAVGVGEEERAGR